MRFDRDSFAEVMDSITRNRSRSLLTGFGVFWGVFMLILLAGGGKGLKQLMEKNFEGFATNTCLAFAENTTKPYKGFKKGRSWDMTYTDASRVKALVPEVDVVSPIVSFWGKTAELGEFTASCSIKGVYSNYSSIESPQLAYGRYINDMDVSAERKVCVIGKKIYNTLFPQGGDPCGETIRVDGMYYTVVGVDFNNGNMSINGSADETVTMPISLVRRAYNTGEVIDLLCFTAQEGVTVSDIVPRVREIIARQHFIDPTDERAIEMMNTQLIFGIVDSLFKGINFLIWLIGLGTILAGAIGVSNIMMVSVRERTVEIGIRRAIGATPGMILSQIISESIILTLASGLAGIVFGVGVLSVVELAMTTDGILKAEFQVGFSMALLSAMLLTVLGVLAGLAPSLRAMEIKPVDAMRDE